jgi:hypothetical protein
VTSALEAWWHWALGALVLAVVFVTGYLMGEDSDTEEEETMNAERAEAELRAALSLLEALRPYVEMDDPGRGAFNCAWTCAFRRAAEAAEAYVKAVDGHG